MLSIFLLQSRTNFSSMPNFRLAAELLELSDANLTTCNLKLTEYFIRFTFDNVLLHVTQAKKTNREVRHLALQFYFLNSSLFILNARIENLIFDCLRKHVRFLSDRISFSPTSEETHNFIYLERNVSNPIFTCFLCWTKITF